MSWPSLQTQKLPARTSNQGFWLCPLHSPKIKISMLSLESCCHLPLLWAACSLLHIMILIPDSHKVANMCGALFHRICHQGMSCPTFHQSLHQLSWIGFCYWSIFVGLQRFVKSEASEKNDDFLFSKWLTIPSITCFTFVQQSCTASQTKLLWSVKRAKLAVEGEGNRQAFLICGLVGMFHEKCWSQAILLVSSHRE